MNIFVEMFNENNMKSLQMLEKHFKKGMKNKDFEAFKKSHPTLLCCILDAMKEQRLPYQLFIGKVAEEIGDVKTIKLLTEAKIEHAKL